MEMVTGWHQEAFDCVSNSLPANVKKFTAKKMFETSIIWLQLLEYAHVHTHTVR